MNGPRCMTICRGRDIDKLLRRIGQMHTPPLSVLIGRSAIACAALILNSTAHARPATYRMNADAGFLEGCFGTCACPLWFSDLTGTFRLHPTTLGGTIDIYEVTGVNWHVAANGEPVSGEGTYTVLNQVSALNRMELDLMVGIDPVDHFDSGTVMIGGQFPHIVISISRDQMVCFDTVFEIDAQPVLGDVTGDAIVNLNDLLAVIQSWGACEPLPAVCDADVAPPVVGNGSVNADDLLMVITNWGQ
jgi:hypothetical protein